MSTDLTLHTLLADWEVATQAGRDHTKVTPSATGALCNRRLAFELNGHTPTDTPDPVTMATVGSLLHLGVAVLWDLRDATHPGTGLLGVEYGLDEGGTIDCLRGWTGRREVRDLKSVGRAKFTRWATDGGPGEDVWQQTAEYAARYMRENDLDPTEYRVLMVIDALCRESGRCATYTREWDLDLAAAAERTLLKVEALRGQDPLDVPTTREGRGDWACDSCAFLTACIGPDDGARLPLVSALPEEEAVAWIEDYVMWARIALDADAKAKAARNMLRGTTGRAGRFTIGWTEVPPTVVAAKPETTRAGYSKINIRETPE